jgi:hypothetical protein
MVAMMPLVAIVEISARAAGERSNARAFAAARQSADHSASCSADADSLGSADVLSVPVIGMIVTAMMVNDGRRSRSWNQ